MSEPVKPVMPDAAKLAAEIERIARRIVAVLDVGTKRGTTVPARNADVRAIPAFDPTILIG